jgi:23S rRNA U2552 (ribose-2'-O)-methylase RlmE/FtsJ
VRDEFRSRAAYKLLDINARHRIIKRGSSVIDLGSAPGSWTQVAVAATGSSGSPVTIEAAPPTTTPASAIVPAQTRAPTRRLSILGVAAKEIAQTLVQAAPSPALSAPALQGPGESDGRGASLVIAVDIAAMAPVPGATFIRGDFQLPATREAICNAVGAREVDCVLSDMAHSFVGGSIDHTLQMRLAWTALVFASQVGASHKVRIALLLEVPFN